MKIRCWIFFLPLSLLLAQPSRLAAKDEAAFQLKDYLKQEWRNELVEFPLSKDQLALAKGNKALVDPEGNGIPYQLIEGNDKNPARIAFIANLGPFEKRSYKFDPQKAANNENGIKIEETPDSIRLTNGLTGVSLRKHVSGRQGPIEGILLKSGKWIGGSQLSEGLTPSGWRAAVVTRGPVFAEVECVGKFAAGEEWKMKFRLQAGEPVMLVDETSSLAEEKKWMFSFKRNFEPGAVFYRSGPKRRTVVREEIGSIPQNEPVFTWAPWTHWWENRNGKWFSVFNDRDSDLVMLGARDADVWVDPANLRPKWATLKVLNRDNDLLVELPLQKNERRWMIGALDKEESMALLKEEHKGKAPLPQKYVIKYEFPLNRIKDYVLEWEGEDRRPNMLLTTAAIQRVKEEFPAALPKDESHKLDLDGRMRYALSGADPQYLQGHLNMAVTGLQNLVNQFFQQESHYSFGSMPHRQYPFQDLPNHLDAYLSVSSDVPKERIEQVRAQAAFLGYTLARKDYWSPERGFRANPNMTSVVSMHQVGMGLLISSHPLSRQWVETGLAELKRQLVEWSDVNGGWLEAPHYAMFSYELILSSFLMARNAGFDEYVLHPQMKKVIEWFAKISTPPNVRFYGLRHMPPIGNTLRNETFGQFGLVASLWKEKDPEFASQMQWMFRQQGSSTREASGGLNGFRKLLIDPGIPEKAPAYTSELFPETGVILRNKYPSDRETSLHLIAGKHFEHYDFDSGSITIWGKGRIVADDFGYESREPVSDHSMLESILNGPLMHVKEFFTSEAFDALRGECGGWTRQITFVKDEDPLAPNYFLICDTLADVPTQRATWRLWLASQNVDLIPKGALVHGADDVDTDIQFLLPGNVELTTESKTRHATELNPSGRGIPGASFTQTGVIASARKGRVFSALIYPRLKSENPPVITSLADGRGVKVESAAGTDYVFLSNDAFEFKEGDVSFSGTVGSIQMRGNRKVLCLGAAGSISLKDRTLKSDKAAVEKL